MPFETYFGSEYDDFHLGDEHDEAIWGNGGNDELYGAGGTDLINGGEGNDILGGGDGRDSLSGGSGDDRIDGDAGDDSLDGASGRDRLDGGGGNDSLYGQADRDRLTGGAGNDTLVGGEGVDLYIGGTGIDKISFEFWLGGATPSSGLRVDLATRTVVDDGFGNAERMYSIEGVQGSTDLADIFRGSGGADGFFIYGFSEGDSAFGNGGNDSFYVGGTGIPSLLDGGNGTDLVHFYEGPADVDLAHETMAWGGSSGTIRSVENVQGSDADDRIAGDKQANVLNGLGGADTMSGGKGDDTYFVGHPGDQVIEYGGGGIDLVNSFISYTLPFGTNNLTLLGRASNGRGNNVPNHIIGNDSANMLKGLGRNDVLDGGGGDDRLLGGTGNDILTGGPGRDRFYFETAPDSSSNHDRIVDFRPADDTIFLDRQIFRQIADNGTLSPAAFRSGPAAADRSDRIVHDAATGNIYYDPDGSGGADQVLFATVTAGTVLTHADFSAFI